MRFRTKIFVSALAAGTATLVIATALVSRSVRLQTYERIERTLTNDARLAAEMLSSQPMPLDTDLDQRADVLGGIIRARVTFIAADGRVLGDSERSGANLAAMDNHGTRPEVLQGRATGIGISRRHSDTVGFEMLYVAVPVVSRGTSPVTDVRLALPLTEVEEQLDSVRRAALTSLGIGLALAFLLAWTASALMGRRVKDIADAAARYAEGDLSRSIRDRSQDELGVVARVLDHSVHELGRRISELHADRALMQAMLAGMSEGVLVLDDRGRLQLANDAARRLLDLHHAEPGQPYLEIVRHPQLAGHLEAALRGLSPEPVELELGFEVDRTFVARAAPVRSPTGRGVVVVLHDITDLRRADRIRRDFVANVSHELRTPLTAIHGCVEALTETPDDPADRARFLDIIARHTARMERLVKDLLRLARLDAGQEALERTACSVEALFDAVEAELAPSLQAKRQQVARAIAAGAATVQADPTKLFDIVRNLLENASNYGPEDSRILLASESRNGQVLLQVLDEGPGIPESDLSRVFERFYRVDKARSRGARDPGGTGLGLAIVKHLVGLHGGAVRAANRPQGGAVFTVSLPQ
jgi:two-component system phosphate regulon sensor histidine kinase PhoR